MSVQYYGYSRMPTNLHETFPFLDLEQSKQQLKQYTSVYIPRTTENNRFKFTGTEINQNKHQTPFLQRSIIEGMQIPIFEYYGRVERIEPRPDYVVGIDMSNSSEMKLFKKEFG
jgi:hypothetical protein